MFIRPDTNLYGLMFFMFLGLMVLISPALAQSDQTINVQGLTQTQIKQIQETVNNAKNSVPINVDHLTAYAEVGKNIGLGIAEAAKQIGMAAADFAQTPLGMFAVFLIAWKLILGAMVSSAVSVLLGIGYLII